MVKQITHLKQTTFWKNDTSTGGAMKAAIDNCPFNHVVLHTQTRKNGRTWGHCSPDRLLNLVKKNNGVYEVITKFPCKVYFDIDKTVKPPEELPNANEFLTRIKQYIEQTLPDGDMAISGSVTDTKISYHIILNNYSINSKEELAIVRAIAKHMSRTMDSSIDTAVYTKNRNMKCVNQSKDDGRVQEIIENQDLKKHMITCFINPHTLQFPSQFTYEVFDTVLQEQSKIPFNIGSLPKIVVKVSKDLALDELTARQIIDILPVEGQKFDYKHRVARFCYTNDLTFDDYLNWLRKDGAIIHSNENGRRLWNSLSEFSPCTCQHMFPILKHFCPRIEKDIHWRNFINMFNAPNKLPEEVKRCVNYLSQKDFETEKKYIVVHLGMGNGKTAQTIEYLKNEENFVFITHRQSLHRGTYQRITDADISCVDYMSGNSRTKPNAYNMARRLSICVHSLKHMLEPKHFKVVVIDEIESVLTEFTNDLLNKDLITKKKTLTKFIQLIQSAQKVIVLDAFITNRTLSFLKSIVDKCPSKIPFMDTIHYLHKKPTVSCDFIVKKYEADENDSEILKYEAQNRIKCAAINEICDEINHGKKPFIYSPSKHDMPEISGMIEKKTGTKNIFYNADVSDTVKNTLNNVNEVWGNYDSVLTNSVITCGVNYDRKGFNSAWMFLNQHTDPRQLIQASRRIRDLSSNTINAIYLQNMSNAAVFIDDRSLINCDIYSGIFENLLIEMNASKRKALEYFCKMAGYQLKLSSGHINSRICKEMTELFEECDCTMSFDDIPDIMDVRVEQERLEEAINNQEATMIDKITLQKYYYMNKFKYTVLETKMNIIEGMWNDKVIGFFEKLTNLHEMEDTVFKQIQQENEWEHVIPPSEFVKRNKQVKMSQSLIERIFKEYSFRHLTKLSNRNLIFKHILNKASGYYTIISNYSRETKTTMYDVNELVLDWIPEMLSIIKTGLKSNDTGCLIGGSLL
jgi:hypothetical protein